MTAATQKSLSVFAFLHEGHKEHLECLSGSWEDYVEEDGSFPCHGEGSIPLRINISQESREYLDCLHAFLNCTGGDLSASKRLLTELIMEGARLAKEGVL